jgi:hypothetical protein
VQAGAEDVVDAGELQAELCMPGVSTTTVGSVAPSGATERRLSSSMSG